MKKNEYFEIILTPDEVNEILSSYFKSIEDVDVEDVIYMIEDNPEQVGLPYPSQIVKEIILKGKLNKKKKLM